MPRTIGVFVFDDVELLDVAGTYEVFIEKSAAS